MLGSAQFSTSTVYSYKYKSSQPVSLRTFEPWSAVRAHRLTGRHVGCRVARQQGAFIRAAGTYNILGSTTISLAAWPWYRCSRSRGNSRRHSGPSYHCHECSAGGSSLQQGLTRSRCNGRGIQGGITGSEGGTTWHVSQPNSRTFLSAHAIRPGEAEETTDDDGCDEELHNGGEEHEHEEAATTSAPKGWEMALIPFAAMEATSYAEERSEGDPSQSRQALANQKAVKSKQEGEPLSKAEQFLKDAKANYQRFYDRVYYGDVLPPVGSHVLSYTRFLELVAKKRVKRIYLMSDGQVALVEIPAIGWASQYDTEVRSRADPEKPYYQQRAEWDQEKIRYYVELPGDFWDDGQFMAMMKKHQPVRPVNKQAKMMNLLADHQCTPELVVMDPDNANAFLSTYASQFLPIGALLMLRVFLGVSAWVVKKMGKERKSSMQEAAEQFTRFKGKEYNVAEKGKAAAVTGVSYKDVAGIDNILADIQEVMQMLLGSDKFAAAGAKPPRGILLEGPPGTGKTYLARAMAGEHGVPFFSANGAEFVEMFSGTAAARIRNLFARARKRAPSIVFIDEIDAIGRARGSGPTDPGTQEREQGLLQLLFEMDGFKVADQVLIIGATNRVDILDSALIRPGRFDRIIYMGRPTATNRKKILQVHVGNKPLSRENDDALLGQIAELAVGYSGAELANLLNEAAILAVRRSKEEIDFPLLLQAMEKVKLGLPQSKLPDGEAKTRLANVQAGRAVAFALTPGLPPIKQVSILPRGNLISSILYFPQEFGKHGDMWHALTAGQRRVNAVDVDQQQLSVFDLCTGLLVPLYAARATEVVFYGKGGATMSSSREMSAAGDLAWYLVVSSTLHPYFRDVPVVYAMDMGGELDPTTQGMEGTFEPLVKQMLDSAYQKALRLVQQRRDTIEQVAQEMLNDKETETISGERLVEIIDTTPLAPVLPYSENGCANLADSLAARGEAVAGDGSPIPGGPNAAAATAGQVSFHGADVNGSRVGGLSFVRVDQPMSQASAPMGGNGGIVQVSDVLSDPEMQTALQVLMGKKDTLELLGPEQIAGKAERVRRQLLSTPGALERLQAVKSFAMSNNGSGFPPPPPDGAPVAPPASLQDYEQLPDVVEY